MGEEVGMGWGGVGGAMRKTELTVFLPTDSI